MAAETIMCPHWHLHVTKLVTDDEHAPSGNTKQETWREYIYHLKHVQVTLVSCSGDNLEPRSQVWINTLHAVFQVECDR